MLRLDALPIGRKAGRCFTNILRSDVAGCVEQGDRKSIPLNRGYLWEVSCSKHEVFVIDGFDYRFPIATNIRIVAFGENEVSRAYGLPTRW